MNINFFRTIIDCRVALVAATVLLGSSAASVMAEDAWPMWRRDTQGGPVAGEPTLENPRISEDTRLWVSEADIPPGRRGSRDDGRGHDGLQDMERPAAGGFASPIAAAGKVFHYHYRPSGTVYDAQRARGLGLSQEELLALREMNQEEQDEWQQQREQGPQPGAATGANHNEPSDLMGDTPELGPASTANSISPVTGNLVRGHERWLVSATDVITAMDAETGQTVWQTDLTDEGLSFVFFGKGGGALTPAYHDGMVMAMTSTAQVFGLDAESGAIRWTHDLMPRHLQQAAYRRQAMEVDQFAPRFNRDMLVGLVAADGLVIVNDQRWHRVQNSAGTTYHYDTFNSYVALDVHTGEKRWEAPEVGGSGSTPKLVQIDGETYVLAINPFHLTLLHLATGEQIWQSNVGHDSPTCAFNLGVSDEYVVMAARQRDVDGRRFNGYRLDLDGLHKLWSWGEIREFRSNAQIIGDKGYMVVDGQLRCFDPATGDIHTQVPIGDVRPAGGSPFIAYYGGWIFTKGRAENPNPDGADLLDGFWVMKADPEQMESSKRFFDVDTAQPYYVLLFPAFANGNIYFRTDESYKMEAYRLR